MALSHTKLSFLVCFFRCFFINIRLLCKTKSVRSIGNNNNKEPTKVNLRERVVRGKSFVITIINKRSRSLLGDFFEHLPRKMHKTRSLSLLQTLLHNLVTIIDTKLNATHIPQRRQRSCSGHHQCRLWLLNRSD